MKTKQKYQNKFYQLKCCVLIPTYNNQQTLSSVIDRILDYTENIIVVNDGSSDETTKILAAYSQIETIHLPVNQGKGFALKTGFKKAVQLGYRYAISIDSDGQHYPGDLPLFLEKIEKHPDSLLVGARNMRHENVPGASNFGNKFSNFWYWVETGDKLPDTQSGFRLYPVKKLSEMNLVTPRFEFEVEVLVRANWRNIPVLAVPIRVHYEPKEKRVSHFRPFKDFLRISILNSILVLIAFFWIKPLQFYYKLRKKRLKELIREQILNSNQSNLQIALSLAFGVFWGVAPVWGYQMLIAVSLAVVLKLNKVLVLLASNISIPPNIPFIIYASFKMGGYVLNQESQLKFDSDISFDMIKDNLIKYIVGSISLGLVLGILVAGISFVLLKIFRKEPNRLKNPGMVDNT